MLCNSETCPVKGETEMKRLRMITWICRNMKLKDHLSFGEGRLRLGIQDAKLMLRKDVQQGILATDETYIVIRFICSE